MRTVIARSRLIKLPTADKLRRNNNNCAIT